VIDWADLNYPPLIRLFHFNILELKHPEEHRISKFAQWLFIYQNCVFIFNLIVNIVLTAGSVPSAGYGIAISILMLILLFALGMFTHMWCYRSFALESAYSMIVYMIAQILLCIAYILFSIISGSNFEGFTNWVRASTKAGPYVGISDFWKATTIIESVLWLAAAGFGITCVILMGRYFKK